MDARGCMCFTNYSYFQTDRGVVTADRLKVGDKLISDNGKTLTIDRIYKLPEYKVIRMIRMENADTTSVHKFKFCYFKPTQYIKLDDEKVIQAKTLVNMGLAVYERYQVMEFYLISVKPEENDPENASNYEKFHRFVKCDGFNVSVYTHRHPLNNRFGKYHMTMSATE